MSEPNSPSGQPWPDDAAAAEPYKPRGGPLLRPGEAILEALRDLTSVIGALRALIADQVSGGIPAGRQRRDYIKPKPLAVRVQRGPVIIDTASETHCPVSYRKTATLGNRHHVLGILHSVFGNWRRLCHQSSVGRT